MIRKALVGILVVCLVLGMIPVNSAEETQVTNIKKWSENGHYYQLIKKDFVDGSEAKEYVENKERTIEGKVYKGHLACFNLEGERDWIWENIIDPAIETGPMWGNIWVKDENGEPYPIGWGKNWGEEKTETYVLIEYSPALTTPTPKHTPTISTTAWPIFHHDPRHTGYSTSTAPDTANLLWSYDTGAWVHSSPAVVDGKVFVGSGYPDNKIYCLDENTGKLIWSYTTGGRILSSPAVADGKVFVGSDDDYLYCLDKDSGKLEWRFYTRSGTCSPTVVDGKVFLDTFGQRGFCCLDENTGELIWNYKTGLGLCNYPTIADGKVFVGCYCDKIYCLDENTGKLIWSYSVGWWLSSSPTVINGKAFIGCSREKGKNEVLCLDEDTGELIWSYEIGDKVMSSPAVGGGLVFISSVDQRIYCLDENTGKLIWSYKTEGRVFSSSNS